MKAIIFFRNLTTCMQPHKWPFKRWVVFDLLCLCRDSCCKLCLMFSSVEHYCCLLFRFDLTNSNVNSYELDKIAADRRPDVILVKKQYADKGFRNRQRKWKLLRLEREAAMSANSQERFVIILIWCSGLKITFCMGSWCEQVVGL